MWKSVSICMLRNLTMLPHLFRSMQCRFSSTDKSRPSENPNKSFKFQFLQSNLSSCNQGPNYLYITGAARRASLRTGQQGEEAEPRRRGGASRAGVRRLRRPRPALGRHRGQRRRRARHPDPAPRPRQPGPGGRLLGVVTLSSEHAIMVTPSDCLQVK